VDINRFTVRHEKSDFYLAASRQVPYKRIDLIASAFRSMPDKKLVIIGDGPEHKKIKALAGPNIEILGYQPDTVLQDYIGRAKAFIFAAQEDFGILPVEAQACGTPVIAFGRGGARETVLDRITGLLFEEQTEESLIDAVARFERLHKNFRADVIRQHASNFSIEKFRVEIERHVDALLREQAKTAVQPKPPKGVEHMRKFLQ
jgi:glycosyltransferase involved in cell wall biosynthesis